MRKNAHVMLLRFVMAVVVVVMVAVVRWVLVVMMVDGVGDGGGRCGARWWCSSSGLGLRQQW